MLIKGVTQAVAWAAWIWRIWNRSKEYQREAATPMEIGHER